METIVILIVLGVIAYILGQINEVLEGHPLWEKLKMGGLFILLLPFAGFALGGFIGNRMGFKGSWEIGVVGIVFQAAYLVLITLIFRSIASGY